MADTQNQSSSSTSAKAAKPGPSKPISDTELAELYKLLREVNNVCNMQAYWFMRRWFSRLLTATLVMSGLLALSLLTNFVIHQQKVDRQYFGLDFKTGRQIPMVPLSDAYMSDSALLGFIRQCVEDATSIDYLKYRQQLQAVGGRCFTDPGWASFASSFAASGTGKKMVAERLLATGTTEGPLLILKKYKEDGIFTWIMKVPFRVTYQNEKTVIPQRFNLILKVQRLSTINSDSGVGIAQWIAEDVQ